MKTLSEPHSVTADNAWWRDVTLNHQLLEVELGDGYWTKIESLQ